MDVDDDDDDGLLLYGILLSNRIGALFNALLASLISGMVSFLAINEEKVICDSKDRQMHRCYYFSMNGYFVIHWL